MATRYIISSSSIDLHNDSIPKQLLLKNVEQINSVNKLRFLVEHRRDLPPLGYWDNASLIEHKGYYCITAEQVLFTNRKEVEWDTSLVQEEVGHSISFIDRNELIQGLVISIDKNDFSNQDDIKQWGVNTVNICQGDVKLELHARKSLINDPELIIKIGLGVTAITTLLNPFLKKIGEKIAEDIADDVYEFSKGKVKNFIDKINQIVNVTKNKTKSSNRTLGTIFEIPGEPYIELHIKSNESDTVINAFLESNIKTVREKIELLSNYFNIKEIRFIYDSTLGWKFTYLITDVGLIVGSKEAFAERDDLNQRVLLSPTAGFSMGGGDIKYEKRPKGDFNDSEFKSQQ